MTGFPGAEFVMATPPATLPGGKILLWHRMEGFPSVFLQAAHAQPVGARAAEGFSMEITGKAIARKHTLMKFSETP
jgi:hypothetical protein